MDRGAWQAIVHGVVDLDTTEQLSIAHSTGKEIECHKNMLLKIK